MVWIAGVGSLATAAVGVIAFRNHGSIQPWEILSELLLGIAVVATMLRWYGPDPEPLLLAAGGTQHRHQRDLPIPRRLHLGAVLLVVALGAGWLAENGPHNALHRSVGAIATVCLILGYGLLGHILASAIRRMPFEAVLGSSLLMSLVGLWSLSFLGIAVKFFGRLF